jgi:hypothetical protein
MYGPIFYALVACWASPTTGLCDDYRAMSEKSPKIALWHRADILRTNNARGSVPPMLGV